ncbi:L2 [Wesgulfec papillomavirus]|nr:L2 [Wesgulfec papillomavirus]
MVQDNGSFWTWEHGHRVYHPKSEKWYEKISKWFASILYTGGLEYTAEEAAAGITSRVLPEGVSTLVEEIPLDPIGATTEHVQVVDDMAAPIERLPIGNITSPQHAQVDVMAPGEEVVIWERPSNVTPDLSWNREFITAEDIHGEEMELFDRSHVAGNLDREPLNPQFATSTPQGRLPARVNFRRAWARRNIPYGEEEGVVEERPGWLARTRARLSPFNARSGAYNRLTNDLDRISMVEGEELEMENLDWTQGASSAAGGSNPPPEPSFLAEPNDIEMNEVNWDVDEEINWNHSNSTEFPSDMMRNQVRPGGARRPQTLSSFARSFVRRRGNPGGIMEDMGLETSRVRASREGHGFDVEENGIWKRKGVQVGPGPQSERKRAATRLTGRPPKNHHSQPAHQITPSSHIPKRKRGEDVNLSISAKGKICKKKKKCVKRKGRKCVKYVLRCND